MATTARVELPKKVATVFAKPRGSYQYRWLTGGRGSGKSFGAAKVAAIWGMVEPLRILCAREFQASIPESFHAELKAAIASEPWLEAAYDVGVDYLRGRNGTQFIFRGLRRNAQSIKSLAGIDLTIVEEAEDVPEVSWLALEATVFRKPKSELWSIWNGRMENSPVDQRFIRNPPQNGIGRHVNWSDNPFFPPLMDALRKREQERLDPATYAHVWEGDYLRNSASQVFSGKWQVRSFEPGADWNGPYYGVDFGFAQDPTTAVEVWVADSRLWVRREVGKVGLELDHTAPTLIDAMPGIERHVSRADSARPESISYLKRHGLGRIEGVKKWQGSVEDGIAHLKSYKEIVVHPECRATAQELRLYSYKTDKLTGDVLPQVVDAHNHYVDAIRYAVNPLIQAGGADIRKWVM
ncbi:PBSX family phage terminase large subunit [Tropicimonas sp. IMCC34011]|uniref:PBSX family phage terminase large subunit n=1 Tax=Tropicimonas sp. IMCC34011 TaxID=2248759 RepID=UPI000E2864F4|nr:terminase large subunit [Tropicimonas sp. IMCC34011]